MWNSMRKYILSTIAGVALLAAGGVATVASAHGFGVQVGIRLPPLPVVIAPAPAYYPAPYAAPYYAPPPPVYYPPRVVYAPPVYYPPRVVYTRPVYRHGYAYGHHGYRGHWR